MWLVLAATAACAGTAGTAVRAPRDQGTRWQARLLRIEDTRRDEPAFVDSLAVSTDGGARRAAALTIGRLTARSHLAVIRRLATDADSGVAATALFALGLLKDSASVALASTALRRHGAVAVEAAWLLGETGASGREAIVSALTDSGLPSATRGALLLAAARLRPVPAAAVVRFVASVDTGLAWRAAYVLARVRSAAGVRALLAASSAPASELREQVARGLARPAAGDSLATEAQRALTRLVRDPDARVRINAVRSGATYGASWRASVVMALRDADAGVRLAAAQSLTLVGDSTAGFWMRAFDADTAFAVQEAVADGAARAGAHVAGERTWRGSSEWNRRAAVAQLDSRGQATTALERLRPWMLDRDGRVRAMTTGAIATLADSATTRFAAKGLLRDALRDADVGVRAAALTGLASGATSDDLAAALTSYDVALTDGDIDARLAFWQLADSALTHNRGVLPDSVHQRLAAIARPEQPLERVAAARISRFSAWRDSGGTPRDLAWYEDRAREMVRRSPVARIETARGTLELRLAPSDAPLTVHNFVSLAERGYFDGQRFHRVVPNFVVQAGDPRGDGSGGPGYAIRDELNRLRYARGVVGMALSGPHTGGSQFFVTHSAQPHLDGGYTVFGRLIAGGEVLDRIVQGDRIVRVTIR